MSSPQLPTPQRILAETWRLMEERQGQGVRIEDVAKAAGVSRQAVYLHFDSRAILLKATLDYVEEVLRFRERILPVFGKSGEDGLNALIDFWSAFIVDSYGISKAFLTARHHDPDAAAVWNEKMDALYQGCLSIMRCTQRDGLLRAGWTPETAADLVWSTISIENWEHLTIERGWARGEYVERMKQLLTQLLTIQR